MARVLLDGEAPSTAENFQRIASWFSASELEFVQQALRRGAIYGLSYMGNENTDKCGCLFSALSIAEGMVPGSDDQFDRALRLSLQFNDRRLSDNGDGDVEQFVAHIRYGDKPKNSRHALKLDRWLTKAITGKAV